MKGLLVWQAALLWLGMIVATTWIVRQEVQLVRWALSDDAPLRHTVPSGTWSPAITKVIIRMPTDCSGGYATGIDENGAAECGYFAPLKINNDFNIVGTITLESHNVFATSTFQHLGGK